jgi:flagellar biosynthesis protein FlhB
MSIALTLSAILIAIALVSLRFQFAGFQRLRARQAMPSDDRRYLRGQIQRRTINAILMLALAGLIAYAFISGMQQRFDEISNLKDLDPPQKPTDDDRAFIKFLTYYWILILALLFFVCFIAIVDYLATHLYGRQQIRRIQSEQRTLLERDLAVYKQQRENDRMRGTE